MSTWQTVMLGAIAGATIFLSLPLGRMRSGDRGLRIFLNGVSAGILLFLLFDILANATEPLEAAVIELHAGTGSFGTFAGLSLVYVIGMGVGLTSLLYLSRFLRGRKPKQSLGPGAMAVAEAGAGVPQADAQGALRLGMSIAAGIGLHNFSEGLAIGSAAHGGEISLALLLVIGFALHNATEGFGIVGPLAAEGVRGSWPYLLTAGLVAGAPTFLGTLVGTVFDSVYVFVGFLALAAGAITYVVAELLFTGRRMSWTITVWGLFAGFVLGLATEMILIAAGA